MSISLFDLKRPEGGNVGAGGGIDSEIILIPEENIDWATFPDRSADLSAIETTIPLKQNKYMRSFYSTQGTIKPGQKMIKGGNDDSGGWEVSIECFHPGLNAEIIGWISAFAYPFKGIVIIQNCADDKKYIFGEKCNLMKVDNVETLWGEEVDKEKGSKLTFKGKQSQPFCLYKGSLVYDPGSESI